MYLDPAFGYYLSPALRRIWAPAVNWTRLQAERHYNEPDYLTCNPTSRHGTGYTFTWHRPTVEPVCLLYMYIRSKSKKITEKNLETTRLFLIWSVVYMLHDDVIKWKHFLRYWPFVKESTGHQWIPLTKASDAKALVFSVICAWTNGSASNDRVPGDLRRHHAHYDVTVMWWIEVQVAAWDVLRLRTETGDWWFKRNNFGEYRFQADKTKSLRINRTPHNGPLLFIH